MQYLVGDIINPIKYKCVHPTPFFGIFKGDPSLAFHAFMPNAQAVSVFSAKLSAAGRTRKQGDFTRRNLADVECVVRLDEDSEIVE